MPAAPAMTTRGVATGLYGKMPAHGDFVRRNLPKSFIDPWDAWLAAGIAAARARLGEAWDETWRQAPVWRFSLPPGACGPDPVTGVMVPSEDAVGRQFPLTIAAVFADAVAGAGDEYWFDRIAQALISGRGGGVDADSISAGLPDPDALAEPPELGWRCDGVPGRAPPMAWPLAGLPPVESFLLLLDPAHSGDGT